MPKLSKQKLNLIKKELINLFRTENIKFIDVPSWLTNINYIIEVNNKKYFLRSAWAERQFWMFWWLIEKESKILKILWEYWITPKLIQYYKNNEIEFLVCEYTEWKMWQFFHKEIEQVIQLLQNFQNINADKFNFLDKYSFFKEHKKIFSDRLKNISNKELLSINKTLFDYLYKEKNWIFKEEFTLAHNDFRADNVILAENKATMIDVEGITIWDKYIDLTEYYIWWIFWKKVDDLKEYNFNEFSQIMTKYWYDNLEKQKFVFMFKLLCYYSRASEYISNNSDNKKTHYVREILDTNIEKFDKQIKKLL
jgi:hypothetical protein